MNIKYVIIFICLVFVLAMSFLLFNQYHQSTTKERKQVDQKQEEGGHMKLNMLVNDQSYTVVLEDNRASRELVRMLPLTIEMNELNGNEKYYYFDTSFSKDEEKVTTIQNGDVMLYGDDCLVLFYDSFSTPYRYTRIGYVENAENLANILGNHSVIITLEQEK